MRTKLLQIESAYNSGRITASEFLQMIQETLVDHKIAFVWYCAFMDYYLDIFLGGKFKYE